MPYSFNPFTGNFDFYKKTPAAGAAGDVQYNDGSNGFTASANFNYSASRLLLTNDFLVRDDVVLNTTGAVFNDGFQDRDFTIRKNTITDAYVYDAGDDKHTFNGDILVSGFLKHTTADTGGTNNTFVGVTSGLNSNTIENTALGAFALANNSGLNANAFGYLSGRDNTGRDLFAFGKQTGQFNTGDFAICLGENSGRNNGGSRVVSLGSFSCEYNTGYDVVAIGFEVLKSHTYGNGNTSIGSRSGYSNITGSFNTFIGYQAGYSETGSRKLYIANSNTTTPLIYGDFVTLDLKINGRLHAVSRKTTILTTSTTETIDTLLTEVIRQTSSGITTSLSNVESGTKILIKNMSGGTNTLNITIEGTASPSIYDGEGFQLIYNGTDWDLY